MTFVGNQQPQVGETMRAELSDEDGAVVRLSWQWSKSSSMDGPWEDVSSTNASYTPKAADVDSYLRATVSYTDVEYDEPDTAIGRDEVRCAGEAVCQRPSDDPRPVHRGV